jgi:hypothetical protein
MFGMASLADIKDDEGQVPGSVYAFLGCGIGTMIGSMTGPSKLLKTELFSSDSSIVGFSHRHDTTHCVC